MIMTVATVMKLLMMVVMVVVVLLVSGIVAMANVFQKAMFAMAHLNSVTLDGVLTVPMVQMKA